MNILHNLISTYDSTDSSDIYHSVIKYIIQHLDEVQNATIYDLAEQTATSRTTIWRLTQKLGYQSYSEFKHELVNTIQQFTYFNRFLPNEDTEDAPGLVREYFRHTHSGLDDLERAVDMAELNRVVDAIHAAQRICFYLYGRFFAELPFQTNLAVDGKTTEMVVRSSDLPAHAETLDDSCFVFITTVEFSDTMDMRPIFKTAKERGAIIFLMSTDESRFTKYADFWIPSCPDGPPPVKGMVHSFKSNMYIDLINMLYRHKYIDKRD